MNYLKFIIFKIKSYEIFNIFKKIKIDYDNKYFNKVLIEF